MIEAFFIDYDPDVTKIAEEHQRAELELFCFGRRSHCCPIGSRRSTLEVHADVLKRAPNQSGTIKLFRPGAIEMICRAHVRLNRSQQRLIEAIGQADRWNQNGFDRRLRDDHSADSSRPTFLQRRSQSLRFEAIY